MNERRMRFWLGAFVLLALVLLGGLIILFGSFPTFFKRTAPYSVRFTDAPGVAAGTPVRRSGVRIGQVQSVTLEDQSGNVVVQVGVDPRFTIRRNEKPTLITGLLGTDSTIDFIPIEPEPGQPQPDRSVVPPGTELQGVRAATVGTLLNRASEVVPTTQETMNDIRKSIQRLERLTPLMEDTLREGRDLARALRDAVPDARRTLDEYRELGKAARETIPELRKTNDEARELFKGVREAVPELRRTNEEVRELARAVRESVPDLRKTNDEVRELARSVREAVPDARRLMDEYRELGKSVREAVPDLRKTNDEVRELARSLREAVPDARRAIDDLAAAARYWARVGERLNNLLATNENKLTMIVDNLNELLQRGVSLLSEENVRRFNQILRDVQDASANLPSISRNTDELLKESRGTMRRLDSTLQRADQFMNDIGAVTRPLGERGPTIMRNLDESLEKLNRTLTDVREIVRVAGQSDGLLNRLLTDPSIYNHLDQAIVCATKLLPQLNRILKDVETFADKLARHPELIGAGGIVRPSNGLKDPPPVQGPVIRPVP